MLIEKKGILLKIEEESFSTAFLDSIKNGLRPDLMRDRKRRSKTKNGVFRSGFFDQKKSYLILRKAIHIFLIEKSR